MTSPFVILLNDDGTYSLHVEPDATALMQLSAKAVVFWGQKAIDRRGVFHIALSGGNTPKSLFQLLATPDYARQLTWERVHVWWGDERDVPADDKDSNYRMANVALLSQVPIPASNIHRIQTELGPVQAAANYALEVVQVITVGASGAGGASATPAAAPLAPDTTPEQPPRFDLVLLGMGDDGHTASLFPGSEALHITDRLVVSHFVSKVNMNRITFTYPLLNAADVVIFLVSGASKADILKHVLLGTIQPDVLPSQGIAPITGKLFWMCDADAAAQVASGPSYPQDGEFIYRRD